MSVRESRASGSRSSAGSRPSTASRHGADAAGRGQGGAAARGALPLWAAVPAAVTGGLGTALAFPGLSLWPLVFVGVPLVLLALAGRSLGGSLLVGLAAGLSFWLTLISWLTVYLGPAPWLALGGLEAVFFAIGCVLIAAAWRFGDVVLPRGIGRLGVVPLVVAALWTLREHVASTWPYGGFSWGRLAFSQSESPFAGLTAWVGAAGLGFLIAWVCALIVQVVRIRMAEASGAPARAPARSAPRTASGSRFRRAARAMLPAGVVLALLAVPAFPIEQSGRIRVAAVQGDSDAGLFAEYVPGEILEDHLDATEPLFGEDVDLVVWPETASDLDPLRSREAASVLDRVSAELDAPLIVGTRTSDGDELYNSLLLWQTGQGATDQYDKLHPVPFAEYIPDRDFWYPLAPDLLSLIPRDYTLGSRDNVFDVDGVIAGLAICFDIVDDGLVRQMVDGGAEILVAPTNNADFGRTEESVQQLAIARLRAIETGRSVVNISTVGTSAIIGPTGETIDILPTFEPGAMVQDVPLSSTTTPATVAGAGIDLGVSLAGLAALMLLAGAARRSSRRNAVRPLS